MPVTLLPQRVEEFTTDLNEQQIGYALDANVLTGFDPFGLKPFYGGFTSYDFSVRRTRGRFKKQSMGPTVQGAYSRHGSQMRVTLSLSPHPVLIVAFAFLFFPMILFWVGGLMEFVKTHDMGVVVGGLVPCAVIYAGFWGIFQMQCGSDVRFWKFALQLREVRA